MTLAALKIATQNFDLSWLGFVFSESFLLLCGGVGGWGSRRKAHFLMEEALQPSMLKGCVALDLNHNCRSVVAGLSAVVRGAYIMKGWLVKSSQELLSGIHGESAKQGP